MVKLRKLWSLLQDLSGESAYERYCAHLRLRHPERPLPTAKQFYLASLCEKYSRPSRCC